mmetsp:Transcript_13949/g.24686  ORF Transcript_13949/g.24686 Transcript_13949/m.24686 type:complete len:752 (+) Transcript_13949:261-2516(+)
MKSRGGVNRSFLSRAGHDGVVAAPLGDGEAVSVCSEKALSLRKKQARASGSLDLGGIGLGNVTKAFMHDAMNAVGDDEQWWTVVGIRELKLSNNQVEDVEYDAFDDAKETMESILIDNNKLKGIPEAFFELQLLKRLNFANNEIVSVPDRFDVFCETLVALDLGHNKISEIPQSVNFLYNLRELILHFNSIQSLYYPMPRNLDTLVLNHNSLEYISAEVFKEAMSLRVLDLSNNKLQEIPESLSRLPSLQHLDLRYNKIKCLSMEIPENSNLDQLLLGFNRISTIEGACLHRASKLSVLDIRENQLSSLPEYDLLQCINLKQLDITNNNLADLPVFIGYMNALQTLNATGNPVRGIRYSMLESGTEKLKAYLRTRGPPPTVLPNPQTRGLVPPKEPLQALLWENDDLREAVALAKRTGTLKLDNKMHDEGKYLDLILDSFCESDGEDVLREIGLAGNQFSHVPQALFTSRACCSLISLNLEDNRIEDVNISAMRPLVHLQKLVLRNNNLGAFLDCPEASRSSFPSMRNLDLRQNALQCIPSAVAFVFPNLVELLVGFNLIRRNEPALQSLQRLEKLDLSNNKIEEFPLLSLQLPNLSYLNLENNCIRAIPCEVALCPALKVFLVSGNPQRGIRAHIVAEGSTAVLDYLKNRCGPAETKQAAIRYSEPSSQSAATNVRTVGEREGTTTGSMERTALPDPKEMAALQSQIEQAELRIENDFSLSAAARNGLKRQLARDRANFLRLQRQLNVSK